MGRDLTSPHDKAKGMADRFFGKRVLKRGLQGFLALVLLLVLVGAIVQTVASRRYLRANPPLGQMISVGSHDLHFYCTGEGSPTVVLEAGAGMGLVSWSTIQDELGRFTETCSYDRAGYGWSEPGPKPRNARQITSELSTLLENAEKAGPYVLVGHSFGGLIIRLFSHTHPGQVAGLVLVDGIHEDGGEVWGQESALYRPTWRLAPVLARIGLVRLGAGSVLPQIGAVADEAYRHMLQQASLSRAVSALSAELLSLPTSEAQLRGTGRSLGELPLIVVAAGHLGLPGQFPAEWVEEQYPRWLELQHELTTRSSRGELRIVEDSWHGIQWDRPDAVIQAVREIIEEVRSHDL
jgi:pimeloyl-ACP methyl ester carboxylesterase